MPYSYEDRILLVFSLAYTHNIEPTCSHHWLVFDVGVVLAKSFDVVQAPPKPHLLNTTHHHLGHWSRAWSTIYNILLTCSRIVSSWLHFWCFVASSWVGVASDPSQAAALSSTLTSSEAGRTPACSPCAWTVSTIMMGINEQKSLKCQLEIVTFLLWT